MLHLILKSHKNGFSNSTTDLLHQNITRHISFSPFAIVIPKYLGQNPNGPGEHLPISNFISFLQDAQLVNLG